MSPPNSFLPPTLVLQPDHQPPLPLLEKTDILCPDHSREEVWNRRKGTHNHRRHARRKSVTDEDLEELKGCIELGFGFGHEEEVEPRLSDALPALDFYHAVNMYRLYYDTVLKSPTSPSMSSSSSTTSDCDSPLPISSPDSIVSPGDNPETVKTRLRQWAQVVACSVRQSSVKM